MGDAVNRQNNQNLFIAFNSNRLRRYCLLRIKTKSMHQFMACQNLLCLLPNLHLEKIVMLSRMDW